MTLSFIFLEDPSTVCSISFLCLTNGLYLFAVFRNWQKMSFSSPQNFCQCQWNVLKQLCMRREYGEKNVLKKGGGKLRNEDLVLEQEVCMCALACVLFCFVLFFLNPLELSSWFHQMLLRTSTCGKMLLFLYFLFNIFSWLPLPHYQYSIISRSLSLLTVEKYYYSVLLYCFYGQICSLLYLV